MKKKGVVFRNILAGALVVVLALALAFGLYTKDYYTMLPGTEDDLYQTVTLHTEGDLTIIGDPRAATAAYWWRCPSIWPS